MKLDRNGIDFIKDFEKLSLTPYLCQGKKWTIGWGHTKGVTADTPAITLRKAALLFHEDVSEVEAAIDKHVTVALTQNEFNALVSFAFNAGVGPLRTSTLVHKLNQGDKQAAAREFGRWIYVDMDPRPDVRDMQPSEGLRKRRRAETEMFLADFQEKRDKASAG